MSLIAFLCPRLSISRYSKRSEIAIPLIRRSFRVTTTGQSEASHQSITDPPPLEPSLLPTQTEEGALLETKERPLGTRRPRRPLPFAQQPYQCFQEARKLLAADREEKLKLIEEERKRIAKWQARDAAECGGEASKKGRLVAMHLHLQRLKILADINDPVIKMRFEDGLGKDSSKK